MSATDELRRLLDERGVEWWQSANTLGCIFTRWYSPLFGDEVCAMENGEEGLVLFNHFMTPEQVVAATLGPCSDSCNCTNGERTGTCRNVHEPPKDTTFWPAPHFKCSECGATHVSMEYVFYCPNCGRKVVDE